MKSVREANRDYLAELEKRSKKSRVYSSYQLIGLEIATILGDAKHKSLYIKLVKEGDAEKLLRLAKTVAERPSIKNRGAYFMKMKQLSANHEDISKLVKSRKRAKNEKKK